MSVGDEGAALGFGYAPDPANPGWMTWSMRHQLRFNAVLGPVAVRVEAPLTARVRMQPTMAHSNVHDAVHGAAMLAFIDVSLFAATYACGGSAARRGR